MSLTISFESPCGDVHADSCGCYQLTIFGFVTGYTGTARLVVFDEESPKEYTALTNELGAVGFCVSGRLPEGEKKKNYPIMLSTPHEQQRSFFTVEASGSAVRNPVSPVQYEQVR